MRNSIIQCLSRAISVHIFVPVKEVLKWKYQRIFRPTIKEDYMQYVGLSDTDLRHVYVGTLCNLQYDSIGIFMDNINSTTMKNDFLLFCLTNLWTFM